LSLRPPTSFAIVFSAVGISTVYQGKQTVAFVASILFAFAPECLLFMLALRLSLAAKQMAAQNMLVKEQQGVDTLGSLMLLATDKTSPPMHNEMTVANLWSGALLYNVFAGVWLRLACRHSRLTSLA
jgi:sodium/potassium-transporting ATPase subunit alpha